MSGRFVIRPKARRDIREIAGYIAADNLDASDRFIDEVYSAFHLLAGMPDMGSARRFRREGLTGLRVWRVPHFKKYLILYRPRPDSIEIIRVLHGARNVERLLGI
jgi:toxin ParE1/3/4